MVEEKNKVENRFAMDMIGKSLNKCPCGLPAMIEVEDNLVEIYCQACSNHYSNRTTNKCSNVYHANDLWNELIKQDQIRINDGSSRSLEPWQQSVVDESIELFRKIEKLRRIIESPNNEDDLLNEQLISMLNYGDTLCKRISRYRKQKRW